jgi:hypothetical protein
LVESDLLLAKVIVRNKGEVPVKFSERLGCMMGTIQFETAHQGEHGFKDVRAPMQGAISGVGGQAVVIEPGTEYCTYEPLHVAVEATVMPGTGEVKSEWRPAFARAGKVHLRVRAHVGNVWYTSKPVTLRVTEVPAEAAKHMRATVLSLGDGLNSIHALHPSSGELAAIAADLPQSNLKHSLTWLRTVSDLRDAQGPDNLRAAIDAFKTAIRQLDPVTADIAHLMAARELVQRKDYPAAMDMLSRVKCASHESDWLKRQIEDHVKER